MTLNFEKIGFFRNPYSHPLSTIIINKEGSPRLPRSKIQWKATLTQRDNSELLETYRYQMDTFSTVKGEIRDWFHENHQGQIVIYAGKGATWINFYSLKDAEIFRLIYLGY